MNPKKTQIATEYDGNSRIGAIETATQLTAHSSLNPLTPNSRNVKLYEIIKHTTQFINVEKQPYPPQGSRSKTKST